MKDVIKIAIAEDNSFLLQSIKEKLGLFDYLKIKHIVCHGVELMEKLEQDHNVDVILMDIQMPEMDGIEATNLVKSKYPQIKVIMLTRIYLSLFRQVLMAICLRKPIRMNWKKVYVR